jgi:1L-myo-inositol 1-phosphate cytidylyltransferase
VIRTAVVLAAGEGSRLREVAASKPLCSVAGRPLIDHALAGLAKAGMTRVIVVLGYRGEEVASHLAARPQALHIDLAWSDHKMPNGTSVLMAEPLLGGEDALLTMCDHLVEPALYAHVAASGSGEGLTLGIDRRLAHEWIDPTDVTRVATCGDRITAIGKGLGQHDSYDTGVFAISSKLTAALQTLKSAALTDGVRLLAARGEAGVSDVSAFDWIDVDDARAVDLADRYWRESGSSQQHRRLSG